MKHSIPVKFLAILLCALTLLGALGSAAGILVMAEMDLYNLTVDQVKEERFHDMGNSFAQNVAQDYANQNLGGNPAALLNDITMSPFIYWFNNVFDANYFGYRLLDENGNVLDQMNPEFAQNKKVSSYTFPVEGEYMRLLSTYPQSEQIDPEISDLPYVQNNVPEDGRSIFRMVVQYDDGSEFDLRSAAVNGERGTIANAYYAPHDGQLVIDPTMHYSEMYEDLPIVYIAAWDADDNLMYEASGSSGIGSFTMSSSYGFVFLPTVSPETESTLNGETTVFVDDINPDGHGIYGYNIVYTDGYGHNMFSKKMIGSGYRPTDDELVINLNYRAEEPELDTPVQSLILYSMDEEVIYHAHNPGVLGWFTESENGYAFTFAPTATDIPTEDPYLYDAIPADGCEVYGLNYSTADSSTGVGSMDPIGFLYYGENNRVMFRSYDPGLVEIEISGVTLTGISFLDENSQPIYEATDPDGVGFFNQDGTNKDVFHSTLTGDKKAGGDILDSEGNVLLEVTASAEIWQAYFLDANRSVLYQAASFDVPLGSFFYDDEGYAHLTIDLTQPDSYTVNGQLPQGQLCGVTLYGLEGQTIYDGFNKEGLGAISFGDSRSHVFFTSNEPDTAPIAAPASESVNYDGIAPMEQVAEEAENTTPAVTEVPAEPSADPTVPDETVYPEAHPSTTAPAIEPTVPATTPVDQTIAPTAEATVPATAAQMPEATEETIAEETVLTATEPVMAKALRTSSNTYEYYDSDTQQWMVAEVVYEDIPAWTVEIYLLPGAYTHEAVYELLETLQGFRHELFIVLAISGLLFAIFFVYLCCAAGRKPGCAEVHAAGLNCLPLDLYTGLAVGAVCLIAVLGAEGTNHLLEQKMEVGFIFAICMAYLGCLVAVGFLYGLVAQFKTPRRYWLKNTLCARFFRFVIRFAKWLETWLSQKGLPFLGKWIKKLWKFSVKAVLWTYRTCEKLLRRTCCTCKTVLHWVLTLIRKISHWFTKKLRRFLSLLPLTWQWLLAGFMIIFVLLIAIDGFKDGSDVALPLGLAIAIGAVVYASHCFGVLSESAKRMGKGDLDTKVEDKLLLGCFEDFASDLNALADVAVVAAQKQLKSERMKTELITNVSHDIKTPLTSIINYVDLLQKPHTEEQQEQYLEVLDRQSQRLKKLIDDLMDMSKASTGNMSVDIIRLDAIESVNQALGEFADKLDRAQLTPVFRHTEDAAPILADGRLVWRVMSNILSNAVKYAMPGTRLYIDLMTLDGKVVISIKNISREELNMDAEELMERFVRGDDSRNTEGSGLGLNIAKSLMELQKGQLQLLVDGDLFKVTLIFPSV